jgi:Fur family zinc uptake transcriptional regulator
MKNNRSLIQHIKAYCGEKKINLTPLRESILSLLSANKNTLSAYDLLRELRKTHPKAEPPTVYRVLEFFQENGLVHRVESNNTYILCLHPETSHTSQILICKTCNSTVEIEDQNFLTTLQKVVKKSDFILSDDVIEIRGFCSSKCQSI